ncbi:stage III sporulation protein AE [Thermohalobacter berrensis]|uniref:Stage III sporulation protein AE n=1 Tax=Thermohalobacter berrensis TaxID=99594 RepID=A0A419TAT3_9FIRM|nr:stage III sporulation protein AE [Thermohalobacter berrensis]RKD34573.1 stage III sporulation protein AE [Thermohalobacter berrensis]
MLRKTILILTLILILPSIVFCDDIDNTEKIIDEQLKNLRLDELQKLIVEINNTSNQYLPKIQFKQFIISLIKGEQVINVEEILTGILKIIFNEVIANSYLLGKLLILSIIFAILTNLQSAFEKNTISKLSFYVCYLVLLSIAIKSFTIGMGIGKQAIEDMVVFIQALLPVLITLLVAVGGIASSALFQPIILGAVSVISTLMKDIILPLIFFSAIIGIVSKMSERIQISRLSSLIRQISIAIIGFTMTIFIGVMSIQGATTAKVDGLTIRTAKFAVDSFIPIVGGFISDAMDTVVGCSMVLKNAVGVVGLIALFIVCIIPIIKLLSLILIYKVVCVVIEPISDSKIVDCLNEISNSIFLIFATVTSVGVMFFISISIIIGAGNLTLLMR